ncbi:MAG: uncharacterized protein PWQ97_1266 [Tepidanaerobacteraceae bacterium]|nr:uncharacterized protein [Tepidanaerobacteraceae bacterium]
MNLYDKLKIYLGRAENQQSKPPYESDSHGFEPENFLHKKNEQIEKVLNAVPVENPLGEHLATVNFYEEAFCHAGVRLSQIFDIPADIISLIAKDNCYNNFDFMKSVFIDTETTGLAGGSGTYAFLIGAGYFEGRKFKLIQYFMRDYDEEPAVLHSLKNLVKEFECVVSFNGKAYDIPLLSTRFLINRMENPLDKPFHLDLLSSARRLFKERLPSLSLSSLETNLFSLQRKGDIPSFEIPSIYFRFLRDKDPNPLRPIFYHNRMDVLSLITLIIKTAGALQDPFGSDVCREQDFYCLGKLYEDMEMFEESIKSYSKALEIPGVREKAYMRLSLLYKRLGRWNEAQRLWMRMAQDGIHTVFALVELAKMYEHKTKEYDKAERVTRRALEAAYKRRGFAGNDSEQEIKELKKRLERIMSKQGKTLNNNFYEGGY